MLMVWLVNQNGDARMKCPPVAIICVNANAVGLTVTVLFSKSRVISVSLCVVISYTEKSVC